MTHVIVLGAVCHCAAILVSALISKRKLFLLTATVLLKFFAGIIHQASEEDEISIKVEKESSTSFLWQFVQL